MENYDININYIKKLISSVDSIAKDRSINLGEKLIQDNYKFYQILVNYINGLETYSNEEIHNACVLLENFIKIARGFEEADPTKYGTIENKRPRR